MNDRLKKYLIKKYKARWFDANFWYDAYGEDDTRGNLCMVFSNFYKFLADLL